MLTSEEHRLVEYACKTWADGHVKASLAVFAMLALSSRPQWVGDVQESVREMSRGAMQPDAQTLHRMMRRLDRLGLVRCVRYESRGPGAARKIGGEAWAVFYVEVADIHATLQAAAEQGAKTVRPLVDNGAILFAHLADPAGNRFGVWQRKLVA
ncbi:VOC family protein [Microbacterium testaceum]|uniref:VOC family protein n=1 Tax=Microbacterium testaceum TaxID=2033 RepID=UPI000734FD4C|nr:VOC family protein [Microbacterium testaceum]